MPQLVLILFPLLPILFPLLPLLFPSSSASIATNPYYLDCSRPLRCGGTDINISFPFRLPDSPSYCGVPGYELFCSDIESFLTINISASHYQVKSIDYAHSLLTLVDTDFLGSVCPQTFANTSIDPALFDFSDLDFNMTVYVNCSFPPPLGFSPILCLSDDPLVLPSYYKLQKGKSSFLMDFLGGCQLTAAVPVNDAVVKSLNGSSANFGEALQEGFGLRWKAGMNWCNSCLDAGGVCGYNSTKATLPICFCPNNTAIGSCPYGHKKSSKTGLIIGLSTAGSFGFVGLISSLCFLTRRRRQKARSRPSPSGEGSRITFLATSRKASPGLDSFVHAPIFSYDELYQATDGFDPSRKLGDGGFGTVYKGKLKDGRVVAVKRLYETNTRQLEQFKNEVRIVSLLRHQHLLSLFGCTSRHSQELLLVYEFVPNGTVAEHLHGSRSSSGSFLPWRTRMGIAVEAADALSYLHSAEPQVIHRDVKTDNILLDAGFRVKVADFGLSRLFPLDATHVSTAPQGTPGYLDPEYHRFFQLTDRSDVYSFGVVLMELMSSLPAVDVGREPNEANLAYMGVSRIQRRELGRFVDPRLGYGTDPAVTAMIDRVAELALRCLRPEREARPCIQQVLEDLRRAGSRIAGEEEDDDDGEDALLKSSSVPQCTSPNSVADHTVWVSSSSISSTFSG